MQKSEAWIEEVTYVTCPVCQETIELGPSAICSEGDTYECCEKEFEIVPPKN